MCTGWPTTAMPKPSCLSERAFSRSMVVMWWPVLMWLVAGSDEVDVRWGNVVSCEMSCHVMWCNLMCLHFMWCDFLCCVMSRNALRCHVMSSHVMSCHLLWSDAVQWDEILWVCDALWLVAMSRCVLRNGCVGWIGRWSGDPNYTDLLRTTQYYKVLLRYYSVRHSTTPVLLCTTKYYSSTNFVLQSTTPVLLCTTQIYTSTTTLYYKVLLQYYSVLQSTTPCTTKYAFARREAPTSPNAAPATQNDSHDWSASRMKRHLQCAEQQASPSNLTKYCACHAKWLSWLICATYETSFPMRGATSITLQPHQILRLPRKIAFQNLREIVRKQLKCQFQCAADSNMIRTWSEPDPSMIRAWTRHLAPARSLRLLFALRRRILYWKLQHFALRLSTQISPNTAPATKSDTPRSPNTAPATQNDSHDWCPSHMTRHLQCAEQQISSSNITKCCACHAKWLASSILVTYETLFTMRRATSITFQVHQTLRLPRKMTLMIDVRHIWNVISNARSNRHHPPTSPNTAPATQNCSPKSKKNSLKTVEVSIPMRGRFDHDPTMIRAWTRHLAPARSRRFLFALRRRILYWKLQHFALRLSTQISPNTAPATKSDTPRAPTTAPATKSDTPRAPNTAPATKSNAPRSPNTAPATKSDATRAPNTAPATKSDTPRAPNTAPATTSNAPRSPNTAPATKSQLLLSCYSTELLLNCYSTELLLNCYWTELLLNCYWTALNLLLNWAVTELLLKWAVTELLLNWAEPVTQLSCYWTVTQLSWTCYSTELLLNCYSSELLLNCYSTELLLNCYSTELLLNCYWTELLLNCYWTELNLLLNWAVTELLLKWAVTELLLNWAEPVTQVSCYWTVTQVSCYWTVTQLSCYWTVTQLSWTCYSTELLLNCYSSELLLNCYSTELLLNCYSSELLLNWAVIAFLKLRNSEVSHLNFLWW